jgi:hypothetical protein
VLDIRDAAQITTAASDGAAIPPANAQVRSLADWTMYVSGSHTVPPLTQTPGSARSVDGPAVRCSEMIEQLTGRKVLAFLSQAHVEPDLTTARPGAA